MAKLTAKMALASTAVCIGLAMATAAPAEVFEKQSAISHQARPAHC